VAFDPSEAARDRITREFGIAAADAIDGVYDFHPEVVVVSSPTHLHVVQAAQAAAQGCHLFVEKPLSTQHDGIEYLVSECQSRRLITLVGCNMRFHPGPKMLRRLLHEGAVGVPLSARLQTGSYLPSWRPGTDYRASYSASRDAGGGAILDCIHELDLALWYLGDGQLIAAQSIPANSIGLEVDGLAEILIRHEGGAISSIHLNFIQRDYRRLAQLIGSEGTLYWDFEHPEVLLRRGLGVEQRFALPSRSVVDDMYRDELSYYLDCVRAGRETFNDVARAAQTLAIALRARDLSEVVEKNFA
jgi:predicted dehydrogenase